MGKTTKYQIISTISIDLVAVLGSVFVNLGMEWFNSLAKPAQWIPNIVIPIVWTIIYLFTAIILCVLIKNGSLNTTLLITFIVNGILNISWCLMFFALNLTLIGNIVIIINLIAGWMLIIQLNKFRNKYINLYIIYPLWLSIATTLNLCLWILN